MASLFIVKNSKPIITRTLHNYFLWQFCGRLIMTSSKSLADGMEALKNNPYYNKYSNKIDALRRESPDQLASRWEGYQKESMKRPLQATEERKMSSLSKPKVDLTSSPLLGSCKQRALNDIMKLELIQDKTKEEIEKIWLEYFKKQEGIAAVISKETYQVIEKKSHTFPIFLFPLPRSQGYEFIMCQFSGNEAHFTSLINYQTYKENAPECLTITHYPELLNEKGIVLMRGEFDKNVLNANEALCLANQMQLYYGKDDEKRDRLLERFTNVPEDFKHMDLIAELESLSL